MLRLWIVITALSLAQARISIESADIKVDPTYLTEMHNIETDASGKLTLSLKVDVIQEVDGVVMVYGNVSFLHNGEMDQIAKISPIDFCKFLIGEKKNALLQVVWDRLSHFGSLPTKCPIGKATFDFKNIHPDESIIPAALAGGTYQLEIHADLHKGDAVTMLTSTKLQVKVLSA